MKNPGSLSLKPLYLTSLPAFGSGSDKQRGFSLRSRAYEADRSEGVPVPVPATEEVKSEAAQKVKIGIYFATWWALNVVFNIYNKKVLNAYPYPWLTSTLSLAMGSLMMLTSWAIRIAEPPKTDPDFWKALFPVSKRWYFYCCPFGSGRRKQLFFFLVLFGALIQIKIHFFFLFSFVLPK